MISAVALAACLATAQSPRYQPSSTPPKLADALCRAMDSLAVMNVLYEATALVISVEDDEAGTFKYGLELEEPKGWFLNPLVAGTSKSATLLKSRVQLREMVAQPSGLMTGSGAS